MGGGYPFQGRGEGATTSARAVGRKTGGGTNQNPN